MFRIVLVSAAKRGMDIGIATMGLVLAVPILAIGAAAIKLTSRGPVMDYQRRVGRHGRVFTVFKFGPIRDLVAAYRSEFNAAPARAPLPYVW